MRYIEWNARVQTGPEVIVRLKDPHGVEEVGLDQIPRLFLIISPRDAIHSDVRLDEWLGGCIVVDADVHEPFSVPSFDNGFIAE